MDKLENVEERSCEHEFEPITLVENQSILIKRCKKCGVSEKRALDKEAIESLEE